MDQKTRNWRDKQKHLPEFMRDFHDQKDLFKAISQYLEIDDDHPAKNVSWVTAHCYTIDVFLWFMAQHGYTLQKSKSNLEFDDVIATTAEMKNQRNSHLMAITKTPA